LGRYAGERYYRLRERWSGDEEEVPTAEAVRGEGRRALGIEFDVADRSAVEDAVARASEQLGPIDVLVNNAGIVNNIAPLDEMDPAAWDRELSINLSGAFNCIRSVIGGMAERQWGRIVNISSIAALVGLRHQVAYAATKAGLLGLTRTVTKEYAARGVTCNAVLPGMIATPLVQSMPEQMRAALAVRSQAGRLGEPDEVGALVAFLASPAAGYINGQAIAIDGGWTLGPQGE
jgi:NAD(P)-dependent dehydrogenase (short-subunit alcohol dehydrogenase family)